VTHREPRRPSSRLLVSVALFGLALGATLVWLVVLRSEPAAISFGEPRLASAAPFTERSQEAIVAAVRKVGPAVVSIDARFPPPRRTGPLEKLLKEPGEEPEGPFGKASGVIVDGAKGYVVTNAHVVRDASRIRVTLSDARNFEADRVALDDFSDIALLKVKGAKGLPQAALGSADKLPIGSWVIAIGNPFGLQNSVSVGVLSAKDRNILPGPGGNALFDMLQTDASINPGNSGGALVDLQGQVIGIPTVIIPFAQGMGFATSVDVVKQAINQLLTKGRVEHAWIGLTYQPMTEQERARVGLKQPGLVITTVAPDSPADRAGMVVGDIVVQIEGQSLSSAGDLGKRVREVGVGYKLRLGLWRNGRLEQTTTTIAERPLRKGEG
jgi:serine protease Do